MKPSKTAFLVIFLSALITSAAATSVINTGDWKEVAIAKNLADIQGEEEFTVATPDDVRVAEHTVEDPETLYTTGSPTVRDIEDRTGLEFEEERKISWKNFSREGEGYVVVGTEFGSDATAVLPYADKKNYSLVFYRPGVRDLFETSQKPKVFYGVSPEGDFSNSESISGNWQERNLELARRMETDWAVLAPRGYYDPGELESQPVLFRMNHQKLAGFLDNSSIENIKVLGPENMLYSKEIDILTEKDLSIVAKTGRAFTGISDLEGIYGLKRVETSFRRYSLELAEVSTSEGKVNLEFVNGGNTVRIVEGNAGGNDFRLVVPEFSSVQRSVNLSNSSEFTVSYSTGRSSDSKSYSFESLRQEESRPITELEVRDSYFRGGSLIVEIENKGERDVWTLVHAKNDYSRKFIPAGEDENLTLSEVSGEAFTVYQGRFENQYTYSKVYQVGSRNQNPDFIVGILVVLAVILLGAAGYVVYEFTR